MKILLTLLIILMAPLAYGDELQTQAGLQHMHRQMVKVGLTEETSEHLVQAMERARFRETHMFQIKEQLSSSGAAKEIVAPIIEKIHEGAAKNVPPERILVATEKVRERHMHAKQLSQKLGQSNQLGLERIMSECLVAGLTKGDSAQMVEHLKNNNSWQRSREELKTALATETFLAAREMVRQGVNSTTATSALRKLLREEISVQTMSQFRFSFRHRNGEDAASVANRFAGGDTSKQQTGEMAGPGYGQDDKAGNQGDMDDTSAPGEGGDGPGSGGSGDGGGEGGKE